MHVGKLRLLGAVALTTLFSQLTRAQQVPGPLVRMAELEISIRMEAGVLAIYSVAVKDNPTQLRFP